MHRADVQPIVGQDANGALLVTKEGVDIEDIRFSTISIVEKEIMVATFEELIEQQKAIMQSILRSWWFDGHCHPVQHIAHQSERT